MSNDFIDVILEVSFSLSEFNELRDIKYNRHLYNKLVKMAELV